MNEDEAFDYRDSSCEYLSNKHADVTSNARGGKMSDTFVFLMGMDRCELREDTGG